MNALSLWADPKLVYGVAIVAVVLLVATVWLFRRRKQSGRQAGVVCLMLSIVLHLFLILCVPYMNQPNGGSPTPTEDATQNMAIDEITFSTFEPSATIAESADLTEPEPTIDPLPAFAGEELLGDDSEADFPGEEVSPVLMPPVEQTVETSEADEVPDSLLTPGELAMPELGDSFDRALGDMLQDTEEVAVVEEVETPPPAMPVEPLESYVGDQPKEKALAAIPASTDVSATVPGDLQNDFANRSGEAKDIALQTTGGNENTEAAVEAALKFIAQSQRADGAWDPAATGAGVERAPLGESRGGAGSKAETAITGLALLSLMGAGNTHQDGDYADNVFKGLAYLIRAQKPDGSLAGNASPYAATYSHGIASLAMCEAAAITKDPSATTCARRAVAYTIRMQHPTTGGWRYLKGDPGDLSQLGWQAMVLDAGNRAGIDIDRRSIAGVQRFLRTVRGGNSGGLAGYRDNERPTVTMTAEALATRLLIGQRVPKAELEEAEEFMLRQKPGAGQDNYYYWYYATLALHQLQDDSWQEWNDALQTRLLATQRSDGSWPTSSVWGGYGGKIYSTAMGALCLESYYRHAIRNATTRIARLPE